MVFETYRSQARQELQFRQGATRLRQVGVHQHGLAYDLAKSINNESSSQGRFSTPRFSNPRPFQAHMARSAVATGTRAALIAGRIPPRSAMTTAQKNPILTRPGVTARWNTSLSIAF